jgi:hypothetical protein
VNIVKLGLRMHVVEDLQDPVHFMPGVAVLEDILRDTNQKVMNKGTVNLQLRCEGQKTQRQKTARLGEWFSNVLMLLK